jgi:hypothetical protein
MVRFQCENWDKFEENAVTGPVVNQNGAADVFADANRTARARTGQSGQRAQNE